MTPDERTREALALFDELVDVAAATRAGRLAQLDPEPPDPADPLLRLPNLVVAPHVGSATVATRDAMATIAAENLLAGLQGRPLPHAVRA